MKKIILAALALALPGMSVAAPYLPTYGSPNSLQFTAGSLALDMDDIQPEGEERMMPAGDSDTIGVTGTYWGVTGQQGQRYDLRYQHARRIGEGSRARLVIDTPINILHSGPDKVIGEKSGSTALLGTVSVGVELPVKSNWLITPRVSYGFASAPAFFGGNGEIITGSISSRYKLPQVGRGDLVIGNMVAYTKTIDLLLSKSFFAKVDNFVFRNGLAYQLPLKSRMFGRQASIRGSYVFTIATKDPLSYEQTHEVGLNVGVRTREAEQKNSFEQLRIGLLYTHSKNEFVKNFDYDALTLTLGYRF